MLDTIDLQNYGPLETLEWSGLGQINLVLGGHNTGKSFLLKALYSTMKTLEEYRRGDEQRSAADILAQKLYWTFQSERIGDLVTKGADDSLSFSVDVDKRQFMYKFGRTQPNRLFLCETMLNLGQATQSFCQLKRSYRFTALF